MFRALLRRLAIRAFIVFCLIHLGLVLAVYGLASMPRTPETLLSWRLLAGGVSALYGALLLSAFFVIWPLFQLVRKVRQILRWKDWILNELPKIIALIPALAQAIRQAFSSSATPSASPGPPVRSPEGPEGNEPRCDPEAA